MLWTHLIYKMSSFLAICQVYFPIDAMFHNKQSLISNPLLLLGLQTQFQATKGVLVKWTLPSHKKALQVYTIFCNPSLGNRNTWAQ